MDSSGAEANPYDSPCGERCWEDLDGRPAGGALGSWSQAPRKQLTLTSHRPPIVRSFQFLHAGKSPGLQRALAQRIGALPATPPTTNGRGRPPRNADHPRRPLARRPTAPASRPPTTSFPPAPQARLAISPPPQPPCHATPRRPNGAGSRAAPRGGRPFASAPNTPRPDRRQAADAPQKPETLKKQSPDTTPISCPGATDRGGVG